MREVGQQSDSVSDRSCHHAALTGFTLHFGNSKYKHALSPTLPPGLQRMHYLLWLKTNYTNIKDVLPERCKNINVSGLKSLQMQSARWLCRGIMIYVARQNLISTAHVDPNCGKTASRAPQTGFFSCHQSSGSSDSAVPQRADREQGIWKTSHSEGYIRYHFRLGDVRGKYENQKTPLMAEDMSMKCEK